MNKSDFRHLWKEKSEPQWRWGRHLFHRGLRLDWNISALSYSPSRRRNNSNIWSWKTPSCLGVFRLPLQQLPTQLSFVNRISWYLLKSNELKAKPITSKTSARNRCPLEVLGFRSDLGLKTYVASDWCSKIEYSRIEKRRSRIPPDPSESVVTAWLTRTADFPRAHRLYMEQQTPPGFHQTFGSV